MDKFEQEQLRKLRNLAKRYGLPIGAALILVLGLIIGQNVYRQNQARGSEIAVRMYEQFQQINNVLREYQAEGNMTEGTENELIENLAFLAHQLRSNYGYTGYAAYASLGMGRIYALRGNFTLAEEALKWPITNSASPSASTMAKILLARLLLERGATAEAAALIADVPGETAWLMELRGDILRAQNEAAAALAAYEAAIELGADERFINYKISLLKQAL